MDILFVIDSIKNLDKKISLITDNFGNNIKFFVHAKLVADIAKNKFIATNTIAIYNKNVNVTIDKYIKSANYTPTNTLLYYSSADIDSTILNEMRDKIILNPSTIYVKKHFNLFKKCWVWIYNKIVKTVFGMYDEYASIKLQYISENVMRSLIDVKFRNHIFTISESTSIQIDKSKASSFYDMPKFQKSYLINCIVFVLALMGYVVLEKFFKLRFWMYFMIIAVLLAIIISFIVLIVKAILDIRYKN